MFKLLQINVFLFLLIFSSMASDLFGFPLILGIFGKKEPSPRKIQKEVVDSKRSLSTFKNENWKLVWQDQFNYHRYEDLTKNWIVAHETNKMKCSGFLKISCYREINAYLNDGYLILKADQEFGPFISAAVESKRHFGEGRYEIMAKLPSGDAIRASILTKSPTEKYWHQTGQFDIMSYIQVPTIYRTVHVKKGMYGAVSDDFDASKHRGINLNDFHRFAVEWNQTHARFSFDDTFGNMIRLLPGRFLSPKQQIRLQISVGGVHFQPKLTNSEEKTENLQRNHHPSDFYPKYDFYNSPQFVIDYVQIFERNH